MALNNNFKVFGRNTNKLIDEFEGFKPIKSPAPDGVFNRFHETLEKGKQEFEAVDYSCTSEGGGYLPNMEVYEWDRPTRGMETVVYCHSSHLEELRRMAKDGVFVMTNTQSIGFAEKYAKPTWGWEFEDYREFGYELADSPCLVAHDDGHWEVTKL